MTTTAPGRAGVAAFLSGCLLVSCGLPDQEQRAVMDAREVPYGLLRAPSATGSSTPSPPRSEDGTRLYWVNGGGSLVPGLPQRAVSRAREDAAEELLQQLADGPPEAERGRGRSTALAPGTRLGLEALGGAGTVVVDLDLEGTGTEADRLPAAIGQIVLSLTSLRGVTRVRFVNDGQPLEVPLPGGALTATPASRDDYQSLLRHRS